MQMQDITKEYPIRFWVEVVSIEEENALKDFVNGFHIPAPSTTPTSIWIEHSLTPPRPPMQLTAEEPITTMGKVKKAVCVVIKEKPRINQLELKQYLSTWAKVKLSKTTLYRALKELVNEGKIISIKDTTKGKGKRAFIYLLSDMPVISPEEYSKRAADVIAQRVKQPPADVRRCKLCQIVIPKGNVYCNYHTQTHGRGGL